MENATPITEADPHTSQENAAKNVGEIIARLNDVHYLLNVGLYAGKDAEMLTISKDFLIGFKSHLTSLKQG